MTDTTDRLKRSELTLTLIERRSERDIDSTVASCVAWYIVDRELQELEREIRENPGALKAALAQPPT